MDDVHESRQNGMDRVLVKAWKAVAQVSAQHCSCPNSDEHHAVFLGFDVEMEFWYLDVRFVEVTEVFEGMSDSFLVNLDAHALHAQRLQSKLHRIVDETFKSFLKGFLYGKFAARAVLGETLGAKDNVFHVLEATNFRISGCA